MVDVLSTTTRHAVRAKSDCNTGVAAVRNIEAKTVLEAVPETFAGFVPVLQTHAKHARTIPPLSIVRHENGAFCVPESYA